MATVRPQLAIGVVAPGNQLQTLAGSERQVAVAFSRECPVAPAYVLPHRVLVKGMQREESVREPQPIVIRQLVDSDQDIFPLGDTRQDSVSTPEIGAMRVIFAKAWWMVGEDHRIGTQRRLPDVLLAAALAWTIILR